MILLPSPSHLSPNMKLQQNLQHLENVLPLNVWRLNSEAVVLLTVTEICNCLCTVLHTKCFHKLGW